MKENTGAKPALPYSGAKTNFDAVLLFAGSEQVFSNRDAVFADAWLSSTGQASWNSACDIAGTRLGIIDLFDFAAFAQNWLVNVN